MSATNIIATLQGNEAVLSSEISAISVDIAALQQMRSRYAVQCGIPSFDVALSHLLQLRSSKEAQLAMVTSQLRSMEIHVASSADLVHRITHSPGALVNTSIVHPSYVPHPVTLSDRTSYSPPRVAPSVVLHSSSPSYIGGAHLGPSPYPSNGLVQLHTNSGLVVTTNSSILANSPGRVR